MITSCVFEISKACNLSCPYCLSRSGVPNENELSIEEIKAFFDKFPLLSNVKITGGEPFMPCTYEKTIAIARYCVERGIKVQINTNGTFDIPNFDLNPQLINLQVSLDGMKEVHDASRGEGVFDKTVEFIRTMKSKGYTVHTMSVVVEPNWADIETLINFIKYDLEIESKFQIVSPVGRAENLGIDAFKFDTIVNTINQMGGNCRQRIVSCQMTLGNGSSRIAFDDLGNIIPCTYMGDYKFGHISQFNEFRTRLQMKNIMGSKTCSCPAGMCELSSV